MLAISFEAFSFHRAGMMKRIQLRTNGIPDNMTARETILVHGAHGIQQFGGYILMLLAMSFSIEILSAVIIGLMAGFYFSKSWYSSALPILYAQEEDELPVSQISSPGRKGE